MDETMRKIFTLLYIHLVYVTLDGRLINIDYVKNKDEQMFTHYFSVVRTTERSTTGCLAKCGRASIQCAGININQVTGECVGFNTLPVIDQNGNYEMIPRDANWISYYRGTNISKCSKMV